jgi:hypothetical protein
MSTQTLASNKFNIDLSHYPKTGEEMQKQYFTPLLNGGTLTTPSGTEFAVKALTCPSSKEFMTILAQSSTTGDVTARVSLDGKASELLTLPPISGVCANGIISCTPGTWKNCKNYKWDVDKETLVLTETSILNLGGCYCVNKSCNSNSNQIISTIASNLGTGAAAALAQKNPNLIITKTEVVGNIAKFYAQKLGGCNKTKSISPTTKLAKNPAKIAELAKQAKANPTNLWNSISDEIKTEAHKTIKQCSMHRVIESTGVINNDNIMYLSHGEGELEECGPNCLKLTIGNYDYVSNVGWCSMQHKYANITINDITRIKSAKLVSAHWEDLIRVSTNDKKIYAHPAKNWNGKATKNFCSDWWDETKHTKVYKTRQNIEFKNLLKQGSNSINIDIQTGTTGGGNATAVFLLDKSCREAPDRERIIDQCRDFQQNKRCILKEQTADGVAIVRDFISTGKTPISSSRSISNNCQKQVTRDWWRVENTYHCESENKKFDFTKAIERNKFILENTTNTFYKDKINGKIITTKQITLPPYQPPKKCIPTCKIKSKSSVSPVGINGHAFALTNAQEEVISYKQCTGDPRYRQCPVNEDDTVIKDCACLNEFGAAVGFMQTLRMAGRNFGCNKAEK